MIAVLGMVVFPHGVVATRGVHRHGDRVHLGPVRVGHLVLDRSTGAWLALASWVWRRVACR